jgi:hypothetical protein
VIFLILLIIATAVLAAWLLFELARLALFPRPTGGSLQGAPSGPGRVQGAPEVSGSSTARGPRRDTAAVMSTKHQSTAGPGPAEERVYDEDDVEQVILDRLYGGRSRRRR